MNLNPDAVPTFGIAFLLFWLGNAVSRRADSKTKTVWLSLVALLLSVPGMLYVLYYAHFFDRATWFYSLRAFPHSELLASGLGFTSGVIAFWSQPQTLGEKLIVPSVLAALLFVPFAKSALDAIDDTKLRDTCEGEVCLQSTASTCGPNSAASVLKLFGQWPQRSSLLANASPIAEEPKSGMWREPFGNED